MRIKLQIQNFYTISKLQKIFSSSERLLSDVGEHNWQMFDKNVTKYYQNDHYEFENYDTNDLRENKYKQKCINNNC